MEEALTSDSIKQRLRMQNEVLKWLAEFSEKMQQRAKDTAMEVNGLLDLAGAAELDLKNTINTLWNLSRNLLIDHKISDEDDIAHPRKDHAERSAQASIPAQDYEKDILPRYKRALSLGLSSCRKHLHGTERRHETGSAYGPLPHIIGSEEFIHDNSCGITDNLSFRNPQLDFGLTMESKQASSSVEEVDSLELFGPDMLGMPRGSSEKDLTDPLASAASDFKAMLEAALLNPYKFYDEESLSVNDIVGSKMNTGQMHKDVFMPVGSSGEQQSVSHGTSEQLNSTIEEDKSVTGGNLHPDTHVHEFYSSLVGRSLFDNEDLLSFGQKDSADISITVAESNSWHSGIKDTDDLAEGTHYLDMHEAFGDSDQCPMAPAGEDNLTCNEEENGQRASLEEVNNFEMDKRQKPRACEPEDNESSSSVVICDEVLSNKEPCESDADIFEKDKIQNSLQCSLKDNEILSLAANCENNLSNKEPCKSNVDVFEGDESQSSSPHTSKDNESSSLLVCYDDTLANKEPSEADHNFSESLQG